MNKSEIRDLEKQESHESKRITDKYEEPLNVKHYRVGLAAKISGKPDQNPVHCLISPITRKNQIIKPKLNHYPMIFENDKSVSLGLWYLTIGMSCLRKKVEAFQYLSFGRLGLQIYNYRVSAKQFEINYGI